MKNGPNQSHSAAARTTDCSQQPLLFADLGPRQVVAEFTAGDLSSDGGVLLLLLLLHQVDHGLGLPFSCSALPGIAALDLDGDGLYDLIVPTLKECPLPAGLTTAY